uniref:hypothetical protein n=1 Tax=Castellaniella defragrans TaxID=75697 RepID=UPI00333F977E
MTASIPRGQALAEALVAMGVLAAAWLAVAWLGRLQDIDLQAMHASRRQAFAYAYQGIEAAPAAAPGSPYFLGTGQHWESRHAPNLIAGVGGRVFQAPQAPVRQVGDPTSSAAAIRRELRLGDETVWISAVDLTTAGASQVEGGLRDFDQRLLRLTHHTAILRGAGAASGDAQVQATLAGADMLWADAADHSAQLTRALGARVGPLDAAWGRADPQTDWLTPWTAWIPARHLRSGSLP